MVEKIRIASIHDVEPGTGIEIIAAGRVIALYNINGELHALDGVCPHAGGPLGKGTVSGCMVTCPWHGWQFDVKTGKHGLNPNLSHERFEVTQSGEDILIEIPDV